MKAELGEDQLYQDHVRPLKSDLLQLFGSEHLCFTADYEEPDIVLSFAQTNHGTLGNVW